MPIEQAETLRERRVNDLRAALAVVPTTGGALSLEIGCGHGHFLTAYAAAHRNEHCIAVDLLRERLERAARKSARAGLTNITWLKGDAMEVLSAWPESLRITRHVFVLFPDPWPKRRHWKHRLMQEPFLTALAERCAPGTRLCFRTDYGPYFAAGAAAVQEHPAWVLAPLDHWPFEETTVFQARAEGYQSLVATRQ